MEKIIDLSNSAVVKVIYDGLRMEVYISTDFEVVDCACYLYLDNKIIAKSGYKNNERHKFDLSNIDANDIRCKVFFRDKTDYTLKKSKFFKVDLPNKIKYGFSQEISEDINLENHEIILNKFNKIEAYEKVGFRPRADNVPFKLSIPINWLEDPYHDRNWMFQLHAWRMLDAYLNRSKIKDLKYVSDIINDWVGFEKKYNSKWLWYDMSTGLRALKISLYLKICNHLEVPHRIDDLDYLIHEHLRHLSNPKELNSGNHGLFQLHGLKSLTYILNSKEKTQGAFNILKLRNYANQEMSKLIISQLGQYGVHTEDSPDYHFFAHNKITNIVNSPWWKDLNKDIFRLLELGENAKPWLVFPNNKCVPIGDSSTGTTITKLVSLENWPHERYGTQVGARVDGYGIVRSDSTVTIDDSYFLFFQGSFYSQAHKHCDDLSFIVQENGVDIIIDSGKYGYQQDKYRKYFLSTRAHNTIEVDGQSTARLQEYAYGSALIGVPKCINGAWILKGNVDHKINQYKHQRTIIYRPGYEIYVIDITTNNKEGEDRLLSQWWHFDSQANVKIMEDKVIVDTKKGKSIEVVSKSLESKVSHEYHKGYESGNKLIGWVSKSYLEYEPTPTLRVSATLTNISTIVTHFKLNKELLIDPIQSILDKSVLIDYPELSFILNNEVSDY